MPKLIKNSKNIKSTKIVKSKKIGMKKVNKQKTTTNAPKLVNSLQEKARVIDFDSFTEDSDDVTSYYAQANESRILDKDYSEFTVLNTDDDETESFGARAFDPLIQDGDGIDEIIMTYSGLSDE
jgi:hypothetical protein